MHSDSSARAEPYCDLQPPGELAAERLALLLELCSSAVPASE